MNLIVKKDDSEVNLDVVLMFKDENNDINYIIYTDGTKDDNGDLELYASRYIIDNDSYILKNIENEYEWNLIDNMLEAKYKELSE